MLLANDGKMRIVLARADMVQSKAKRGRCKAPCLCKASAFRARVETRVMPTILGVRVSLE